MSARNRRVAPEGPSAQLTTSARASRIYSWLRGAFGAALVVGLSVTIAWGARRHIRSSPRFAVTDISVTGGKRRTEAQLVSETGLAKGVNVFSVDLAAARAKLLGDPWIETAEVTRRLPGKLLISVTEREPACIVVLPEAFLASRDGRMWKRLQPGDPTDLPVVTGLTAEGVGADEAGARQTIARATDLAAEYERSPLAPRGKLEEVHVAPSGDTTLVVGKDGVSVALGQPPYRRKLEEAARIFGDLASRGMHAGIVLLDDEARPERAIARTR